MPPARGYNDAVAGPFDGILARLRQVVDQAVEALPADLKARIQPALEPLNLPELVAVSTRPSQPIVLADLQQWCVRAGQVLRFDMGLDHYEVGALGFRVLAGERWHPIQPRLALGVHDGLPAIRALSLEPFRDGHFFATRDGAPLAWEDLEAEIGGGLTGLVGEAERLLRGGFLTPEAVADALERARPDEPSDFVLARLGVAPLDLWIDALVGRASMPPRSDRKFDDRLGMRLLAAHVITQGDLKKALAAQGTVMPHRPIGDWLEAPAEAIRKALSLQNRATLELADADSLGETLIRWGSISRAAWMGAAAASPSGPATALVKAGRLMPSHLARALTYRENLGRHARVHTVRLGQILVEGGLDRAVLGKALAWQVDQPLPLAELMVLHRLIGPAQAALALATQAARYRAFAEAQLPPLEPRPVPVVLSAVRPRFRLRLTRRSLGVAVLVGLATAYALAYGGRYRGIDYGWWNALFPEPVRTPAIYRPPGGEVHEEATLARQKGRQGVEALDRLELTKGRPGGTVSGIIVTVAATGGPTGMATADLTRFGAGGVATGTVEDSGLFAGHFPPLPTPIAGAQSGGTVPGLGPRPRLPTLTATGNMPGVQTSYGLPGGLIYAMEKPLGFTPPPIAEPSSEPAIMKKFRQDLAKLRATESLHRNKAQTLKAGGKAVEGLGELRLAENVRRSQSVFRARLGEAFFRDGNFRAAEAEFEGAAHDDPSFAMPHYYVGESARKRGDRAKAQKAFLKYLDLAPDGEFASATRKALTELGIKLPG